MDSEERVTPSVVDRGRKERRRVLREWRRLLRPKGMAWAAVCALLLVLVAQVNYLLAHSLIEFWAIFVAGMIFVFARRTRRMTRDRYVEFLGFAYGAVAVLDFCHTLSYKGMGVFPGVTGADTATQLWIAARYVEAGSLLLAPWFARLRWRRDVVGGGVVLLVAALLTSIMILDVFPVCFSDGQGLTQFKVGSELVICAALLGSLASLYFNRDVIGARAWVMLTASVVATILSETMFMLYTDVYAITNTVGHVFKALSFYFVYRLVIRRGLIEPFQFRYRAERELREKDRRLRIAMEGARIGFWEWRRKRDQLFLDSRWLQLLGFETDKQLGTLAALKERIYPPDLDTMNQALSDHAQAKKPYAETDIRLRDGEGRWRWLQTRAYVVETDLVGTPLRMVGFFQDISSRREAEEHVRRLQDELNHAGRITILGQLAAGLAHEINQPLAAISTNVSVARRSLRNTPPDLEQIGAILGDLEHDTQRINGVVRGLRDLIRRGKSGQREALDVNRLIDTVLALSDRDLRSRRISIGVDVPDGLPCIFADPVQMQQVLLNLILNAADAMDEDSHRTGPATLDIVCIRQENSVEICVVDNGPGLDPSIEKNIFEPFRTSREQGVGMGLAISKNIVVSHGGEVWWTRNRERGVTFHFTVPIARQDNMSPVSMKTKSDHTGAPA